MAGLKSRQAELSVPRASAPKADVRANATPATLGYRMPAEWEPHEATWLAWPHERTDWPGKFAPIPWVYADIVRHLARVERVRILVQDRAEERAARRILQKSGADLAAVDFFVAPTNRGWTRDFGAIFVKKCAAAGSSPGPDGTAVPGYAAGVAATKWRFSAWAKYDDWKKDNAAMNRVLPKLKMPVWEPQYRGRPVVLEGGSIEVNGLGTLLTTEECLLSAEQARNPGFERADWEAMFRDYLGATNVLWLGRGIAGDDTHGHVDDLARFVNPTTVVTVVESDRSDANYEPLQENLARLGEMKDENGRPLRIETLPMPQPVWFDGQRLPASYANFYIANKIVLVPTFSDPADRAALNTLAGLFPDREVIGIAARDLVLGLGTLHCMTQQQPAL
jgi:agmatine deiminase